MLSVKTKEHIRRRLTAAAPRWGVLAGSIVALGAAVIFTGSVLRVVHVQDANGQSGTVITAAQNTNTVLRQTGISPLSEKDELVVNRAAGQENIQVLRGYTLSLTADGATQELTMTGGTVADALAKAEITLGEEDIVSPAATAETAEGTEITVHRIRREFYTKEEVVPAETQYLYSSLYYRNKNYSLTLQNGTDGLAQITYCDTYTDGKLTDTSEIDRFTETEMVPSIIKCYGEGASVSHFEGPEIQNGAPVSGVANVFNSCRATGYSASATAKGASGRRLTYGTVAINPNVIPYGSLMYITSDDGRFVYGYAYAADTGIAMMDGRAFIDLYYETYAESVSNAVISVTIYVLDDATTQQYKAANDAILAADTIPGQ